MVAVVAHCQAQSSRVPNFFEYWQSSDSNKTNFTYDSSFKLKIHLKSAEKIRYVLLFEWNGKKQLSDYFDDKIHKRIKNIFSRKPVPKMMNYELDSTNLSVQFDYLYNYSYTETENQQIEKFREQCKSFSPSRNYLAIDNLVPAGTLKPGRKYAIMVYHDVNTAIFDPDSLLLFDPAAPDINSSDLFYRNKTILNKLYFAYKYFAGSLSDPTSNVFKSIDTAYNRLYQQNKFPVFLQNGKPFKYPLQKLITNFNQPVPQFNSYELIERFVDTRRHISAMIVKSVNNDVFDASSLRLFDDNLKKVRDYFKSLNECSSKKCCGANNFDSTIESNVLWTLWSLQMEDWEKINDGSLAVTLKNPYLAASNVGAKNTPSQNLASSIKFIENAKEILTKLEFEKNFENCGVCIDSCCKICHLEKNNFTELYSALKKYAAKLGYTKELMNTLESAYRKFKDSLIIPYVYLGSKIDMYGANSFIIDFQTRTAVHITPVFGYCYYGFGSLFGAGMQGFSPYLGFQINFEPLNQNVPFRLINQKHFWQRLCFTTGWTLASIAKAGKRSDFFGNSTSLYTALGLKLSHVFTFNAGALWFRANNPNPVVTDKAIACIPSASLSINFTASQLLGDFVKLIPSL
ncbi:MAG TPA: hypothetical protein VMT76_06960 [Puia sp.]|nr:hypothetical protein [Puia sp.]